MKKQLPIFFLFLFIAQYSFAQRYQIDTVQYVGHSEEFYDLVIVAEGYTEAQMDTFKADAQKVRDVMALNNAYLPLMDKMNIFSIQTPSVDSGISLRTWNPSPNDPIQEPDIKDTYFGIYFLNSYRAYFLDDSITLKARHVAGEHIPFSDVVLILTNDPIGSGRASFDRVAVAARSTGNFLGFDEYVINHELAHSIGGLSDAYSSSKEEGFNKTTNKDINTIRWKDLLSSSEVGIDSIATGVYIPNLNCMMNIADANYTCPVCSQRLETSIADITDQVPSPHRMYFLGRDDENNTITFGWDPIQGATGYETVLYAYWRNFVFFDTTSTNQYTFTLPEEDMMMIGQYLPSVGVRAFNSKTSTEYKRYAVPSYQVFNPATQTPPPTLLNIEKTSETSYLIEFEQHQHLDGTLIRLYNEVGQFSEILTANNRIELRGLIKDQPYHLQMAAAFPNDNYSVVSSPMSELVALQEAVSTDIDQPEFASNLTLMPNPARDLIRLDLEKVYDHIDLQLISMKGQVIQSLSYTQQSQIPLNIANLNPGLYLLSIRIDNQYKTLKFIKEGKE